MGDVGRYFKAGGKPENLILHFLDFDTGRIDPLWSVNGFKRRIDIFKENKINAIISPDFSSWADYPYAVQIYNYYRSSVLTNDFSKAGFDIIPNVCFSAPKLNNISISVWGNRQDLILIDANHIGRNENNIKRFMDGLSDVVSMLHPKKIWLWSKVLGIIRPALQAYPDIIDIVAPRNYVLYKLYHHRKKVKKDG